MAYKDRMIASRSIAAAVREARVEMKKLADAKHVTTTGATLPAPHRRGVPTSTRLREAVRRDLKSLEKFAGEVIAKAAGSTEADALIEELTTAAEKFMDAEAPDDLWEEWDDSLRKLWGRLAPAAASVYDNAYAGAYGRLINSLDKLYEVLADLTDSGVNAEEIAGVDYDDMYEIAEQLLEETDKSAGDVTAKAAGDTEADALLEELTQAAGKLMELEAPDDLWEEWDSDERNGWNRLATAASAVYDETMLGSTQCSSKRLSSALSKLEQVLADLQDYVQVDAEEMAGVDLDDMMEIADQYLEEEGKSAGDSVARKGVTTTADDLYEIASRLTEVGQEGYAQDLEEAALDLEEGDSAAASRMVTDVRRELEAYQDDEGMREIYDDVLDAALNLGRKGSPSMQSKGEDDQWIDDLAAALEKTTKLVEDFGLDPQSPTAEEILSELQAGDDVTQDLMALIGGLRATADILEDDGEGVQATELRTVSDELENSGFNNKSAKGTRTKDHLDPAEFNDRLKGVREGLNSLLEASEDFHETDAITSAIDMVDQAMAEAESNNWAGAGDLLSDARDYVDGIGDATGTIASLEAFRDEARGYAEDVIDTYGEDKSYSAAARARRRTSKDLDTKRAGEGELEALEADYTTFAREYNAAVQAALTEAQALADGDADEEADQLEAEIEELFIGESLAETPMRSGESYPWDEIASALREVMKWTSLTDAAQASLAEAQSILEQFDGDSWWEQYSEELEARYT